MLMGGAESCPTCHSFVATQWLVVLLPLWPLKSYRILQTRPQEASGFRIPLYRPHLARFYGGLVLMALCGGSIGWSPVFFVLLLCLVLLFPFIVFLW
jgi:hypothetical protein